MSLTRVADHLGDASDGSNTWLEETGSYFQYAPLEDHEIRLLELEPGLPEDPIRCRLIHKERCESYQYEVLSFDWRRSTRTRVPISLNGQTFDTPHEIWTTLHGIRLETRSRFLWTDSICINQRFDSKTQHACSRERNGQLSYLPTIYRKASRLLIWLGRADDNSHLVFEHLDKCRARSYLNWLHYAGETKDAFHKLLRRPWFHRALSAQEVSLCSKATIVCGRHQCDLSELMKCSSFPSTDDYYHPIEGPSSVTHLRHLVQIYLATCIRVRDLFCWYRHCRSEDPRDKIFGALMMNTEIPFGIPIDYTQDVPRLFQMFTQRYIESMQDLEVLHWLGTSKRIDGLPSWVPDYSIINPAGTLPRAIGMSAIYSIHYPLRLLPGFGFRSGNILALRGWHVEKVMQTAERLEARDTALLGSEKFTSIISGWEKLASSLTKKRFPESIIAAFSSTLIGDDDADLLVEHDTPPLVRVKRAPSSYNATEFSKWYECIKECQISKTGAKRSKLWDDASKRYSRAMEQTCYGRKFFITDKGSMGLAPPLTREGDDIVFFPGGKYPFILRARDNGTYELVGDCFLYDLDVFPLLEDRTISTEFLLS
ncbi:heterokaryon incompatibility protein-domain-containing protein [Annulohypoxylon maeteangense]|uniref:heterokaryon incompatibility protein-domain-containing protein n=1 Tax=Annulohypoxylon maeteangense TaxID=1927788 RepID=UPI002008E496|nr:heterokaryon incompatibility protein-domain-containing protein [Annulohypoxylon maeteangense]KAI0890668.1 heterokaryon incompatibility protein-domain-containing protein [Annulohypoxylon maeteangense]